MATARKRGRPHNAVASGENSVAEVRTEAAIRNDIYRASEQVLEIPRQADEIEEGAAGFHADEHIDVTLVASLTSGRRAEEAHVVSPVGSGEPKDLRSVPREQGCNVPDEELYPMHASSDQQRSSVLCRRGPAAHSITRPDANFARQKCFCEFGPSRKATQRSWLSRRLVRSACRALAR